MRIYYIIDGKFDWAINHRHQLLYPGDVALILPGQTVGGSSHVLNHYNLFGGAYLNQARRMIERLLLELRGG
jgi:hypothetical protein